MREIDDATLSPNLVDDTLERQARCDPLREIETDHIDTAAARDLLADDDSLRIEVPSPQRAVERVMIGDGDPIEPDFSRARDELVRSLIAVV
jgi:hypothetical protein